MPAKLKTLNDRIVEAAFLGLEGKLKADIRPLYCLQFARKVVERAMGLADRGFYRLAVGVDADPCAKKLEVLLRKQKPSWVKPTKEVVPGDLLFWPYVTKDGKDWGHVGLVVDIKEELWVAQNTISKAGKQCLGALRLIPLKRMGEPSTVIRIGG